MGDLNGASKTGEGLFKWDEENQQLEYVDGSLLLLSSDSPNTVTKADFFTDPNGAEIRTSGLRRNTQARLSADGSELYLLERIGQTMKVTVVDPSTGEALSSSSFEVTSYSDTSQARVFPGGKELLYGGWIYRSDGSSECLESVDEGAFSNFDNHSRSGPVRDGTVYTAYMIRAGEKDRICIWKNQEGLCTFSSSDDSVLLISDESYVAGKPGENALLTVCENGQVVAGVKKTFDPGFTGYFIVSPEGEPSTMHSVGSADPSSPICSAKESSCFAVLENDGVIRIYDPAQEDPILEITSPDLFAGAVSLCFAGEDRYLGVLSYNGEFSLFDAKTGALLMRDADSGLSTEYGTTVLELSLSPDGTRLICIAAEKTYGERSNGAVYDLETFERVAGIENLAAYCPNDDRLLVFSTDVRFAKFRFFPLYSAQSLLQWPE